MATLLITGAARGIGHELARRAVARGDRVFAVVRKAADRARFEVSDRLHVVVMDVADSASVEQGFAEVDGLLAGASLDAVVNCAALAPPSVLELTSVADFEQVLNTNAVGSFRILKASIPRMRDRGGRIILVTSLWGRASGPLLGAYCASKHAIESLADTARRETAGMDLHVIIAQPGVVKTDMYRDNMPATESLIAGLSPEQNALYGSLHKRYFKTVNGAAGTAITVEQAAAGIEKAIFARRPKTRYQVGMDAKLVCFLNWLLPDRWMDAVLGLSLNRKPL